MHKNNFDAVRLSAACMVLVSHQFVLTGRPEPTLFAGSLGGFGVTIFFSISGYLIAQSWNRSGDLLSFFRKRIARIWPGFAVVTLLAAFVLGPLVTSNSADYFSSPLTLKYLRTMVFDVQYRLPGVFEYNPFPNAVNGSLWTIPIELAWYAILACIGLVGGLRSRWIIALSTALLLAYLLQQRYTGRPGMAPMIAHFGGFFLIGAALSTVRQSMLRFRGTVLGLAGLLTVWLLAMDLDYAAAFVLVPPLAIIVGEASTPVLRSVGRFGDFSYGFYLYAFSVQQTLIWATDGKFSVLAYVVASGLLTLACAALSWRLVEKPAMDFRFIRTSSTVPRPLA